MWKRFVLLLVGLLMAGGAFAQSPWKKKFFRLLGEDRHLDWIEHEQLRPNYADPRVHAAVNCASIGCPALRDEAFTAARLEEQLEDGMLRFMGDAAQLSDDPAERALLRAKTMPVAHLDYDWSLNATGR